MGWTGSSMLGRSSAAAHGRAVSAAGEASAAAELCVAAAAQWGLAVPLALLLLSSGTAEMAAVQQRHPGQCSSRGDKHGSIGINMLMHSSSNAVLGQGFV